jgi:cell division septum initiation protein DivIVA
MPLRPPRAPTASTSEAPLPAPTIACAVPPVQWKKSQAFRIRSSPSTRREADEIRNAAERDALDRRDTATQEAEELVSSSRRQADDLRAAAERDASNLRKAAAQETEQIRGAAEADADRVLRSATEKAEQLLKSAETRSRELVENADLIWRERRRLIEDVRVVGEQFLALGEAEAKRFVRPTKASTASDEPGRPEMSDADLVADLHATVESNAPTDG